MANVLKAYRGAVEPAESAPSGNQSKVYRGAVEPAEAAAPAPAAAGGRTVSLTGTFDPRIALTGIT